MLHRRVAAFAPATSSVCLASRGQVSLALRLDVPSRARRRASQPLCRSRRHLEPRVHMLRTSRRVHVVLALVPLIPRMVLVTPRLVLEVQSRVLVTPRLVLEVQSRVLVPLKMVLQARTLALYALTLVLCALRSVL